MRAILALVLWTLAACAQPAPARGEPALWRITDADSEIWLFGTVHLLPPDLRWRSDRINSAFAAADELVLETDAAPEAQQAIARAALARGLLPEGETLSAKLTAEDRALLTRGAALARLDAAAIERMRPWLAALQLSTSIAVNAGHDPSAGADNVLFNEARATGKRLTFFETGDEQIAILADLPEEAQLRFLTTTLRQLGDQTADLARLDAAWVSGDVAALQALTDPELREAGPDIHAALMTNRNRAWTDEIARRLDGSGRIFIAVGAGHLIGDDSVIALLRARGIEVEGP